MSPRHVAPHRRSGRSAAAALAVAGLATTAVLAAGTAGRAEASAGSAPTVISLSVRSGGAWGGDLVTIRGTGFGGSGAARVSTVLFGTHADDGLTIVNDTTLQAYTPEVRNTRATVDVRVVWRNGTTSARSGADRFTYTVPTIHTRLNGHWSAAQSQAVARRMMPRTARVNNARVAHNPGHWTPAMGRSALHRAAGWLGLPYTWNGGSYTAPTYGDCYGDGLIGEFDCRIWGFDCSGLTMYSWARYEHLAHLAATQRWQAGAYHPSIDQLQPGDLLFVSHGGPTVSHVAMYAGHGYVIQASGSGWPIRYTSIPDLILSHPRYFGATRPMSSGRQGSAPSVTSVSSRRSTVAAGRTITLHGSRLDTTSRVYFGSTPTYRFTIRSATTITVIVPAHAAGTVHVRAVNAWGTSPITARARMTFVAPPVITSAPPSTTTSASPSTGTLRGGSSVRLTAPSPMRDG